MLVDIPLELLPIAPPWMVERLIADALSDIDRGTAQLGHLEDLILETKSSILAMALLTQTKRRLGRRIAAPTHRPWVRVRRFRRVLAAAKSPSSPDYKLAHLACAHGLLQDQFELAVSAINESCGWTYFVWRPRPSNTYKLLRNIVQPLSLLSTTRQLHEVRFTMDVIAELEQPCSRYQQQSIFKYLKDSVKRTLEIVLECHLAGELGRPYVEGRLHVEGEAPGEKLWEQLRVTDLVYDQWARLLAILAEGNSDPLALAAVLSV